MFDSTCSIRDKFLSNLKDLLQKSCSSPRQFNDFYEKLKKMDLPKKRGIFQHVPLFDLYKNSFVLAPKVNIDKEDNINNKIKNLLLEKKNKNRIVFVNGYFEKSLSNYENKQLQVSFIDCFKKISEEKEYNFFSLLSLGFLENVININITNDLFFKKNGCQNKSCDEPLEIINILSNSSGNNILALPKIFINFCKGVDEKVVFSTYSIESKNKIWSNQYVNITLEEDAKAQIATQVEGENKENTFLFNAFRIKQKQRSVSSIDFVLDGSNIEHTDFEINLAGKKASSDVNGLLLLQEKKRSYVNIHMNHLGEKTVSSQLVKSILKDRAVSSFEAEVFIDRLAKGANASQLNNNLILDKKAKAFSKPFLLVKNEDVKATHGATIDRLKKEDLFYLMSKGLSENEAHYLLVKGFCQEIVNRLNIKFIQKRAEKKLLTYLG